MKREIVELKGGIVSCCCPGHDDYPNETYANNRSKRARSRDIKKEHKLARTINKRELRKTLEKDHETQSEESSCS